MAIAIPLCAFYLALLALGTLQATPRRVDFMAFYAAGRLALEGQAAVAYDWARVQLLQADILGVPPEQVAAFLGWVNPPHFLFFVQPFAAGDYGPGWAAWVVATATLFGLAARAVLPGAGMAPSLVALATPGVLFVAVVGQNGLLVGALLGWTFAWMDRRPWAAGIALGLLTIKPQFGVILPVLLVATGRWRVFAAATATALFVMGAALVTYGPDPWWGFFGALTRNEELYLAERTDVLPRIQSVFALAYGLGAPRAAAWMLHGAMAAAVVGVVLRLWLRRPEALEEVRAAAAFAAVFLVTPFTWVYDTPALALAALFLVRAAMREGFLPAERPLLVLACVLTQAAVVLGQSSAWAPAAWLIILACAWRRDRAARVSPARIGSPSAGT
ncbi:glycosyltransferase family 87 protein [Roseomonas fluvialis]|nr:glycosyltransferase family 87 protein [Roseomonas fluvialis]